MKKFLSIFLCMLILMSSLVFVSASADETYSGSIGKNNEINWQISVANEKGILKFSLKDGVTEAAIPNFAYSEDANGSYSNAPWNKSTYGDFRSIISHVMFCDGITEIGNYAFAGMKSLVFVSNMNSVSTFGTGCFKNCVSLYASSIISKNKTTDTIVFGPESFYGVSSEKNNIELDFSQISCKNVKIQEKAFSHAYISKMSFISEKCNFESIDIENSAYEGAEISGWIEFGGRYSTTGTSWCQSIKIGDYAFANCSFDSEFRVTGYFSKNITVGNYAFANSPITYYNISTIESLSPAVSFGEYVFKDCKKLTNFGSSFDYFESEDNFSPFTISKGMFLNAGANSFRFNFSRVNKIAAENTFLNSNGSVLLNNNISLSNISTDFLSNKTKTSIKANIASNAHRYAIENEFTFIQNNDVTPSTVSINKIYSDEKQSEIILEWDKKECCGYKIKRVNKKTSEVNEFSCPFYTTKYEDKTAQAGVEYSYSICTYVNNNISDFSKSVDYALLDLKSNFNLSYNLNENKIVINWGIVPGANGYKIYQESSALTSKILIANTQNTSYTIQNLLYGATYHFTIVPYKTYNGADFVDCASKIITVVPKTVLNKINPRITRTVNSISVIWDAVPNAVGYKVYRRVNGGNWAECSTQKNTSFTEQNLQNNEYHYKICAYKDYQLGECSDEIYVQPLDTDAPDLQLTSNNNSIRLVWSAPYGAEGYQIYRSTGDEKYELIKDKNIGNSYNDSDLKYGLKYSYKVRALKTIDNEIQYGDYSASKQLTLSINLSATTLKKSSVGLNSISLSWSAVSNANKYQILYKRNLTSDWVVLNTVSGTQYAVDNVESGLYVFAIRAVRDYCVSENISNTISETFLDSKSSPNLQVQQNSNSITLSWNKITGADMYDIYRAVGNGKLSLYKTSSENEFVDTSLTYGEKYTYKVIPFKILTSGKKYGASSSECTWIVGISLSAPSVSINRSVSKKVTLTWNNVANAMTYLVYRSTNGNWEKLDEIDNTTFVDENINSNIDYKYKVVPKCRYLEGPASNVVSALFINETAPNITVNKDQATMKNTITIDYPISGVSFEIYRKIDEGVWVLMLKTNEKTITENVSHGHTYSYYVRCIQSLDDGNITSNNSSPVSVYYDYSIKAQRPTLSLININLTKIRLDWTKTIGADSYRIYQKINNGNWKLISTLSETSAILSNLKRGSTYSYRIVAVGKIDCSQDSNIKSVKTLAKKSTHINGKRKKKNKIYLSWTSTFGTTKYEVYVATSKNRKFKKKAETKKTKITIKKCSKKNTYFFFVRPYQLINGKKYYGKKSFVAIIPKSKK